jgi:hypothetical protein
MPRWLPGILARVADLAASRRVLFTLKARRELAALDLGLDEDDACDVLVRLKAEDSIGRLASEITGEWLYLFKPTIAGMVLYVKIIVRSNCIVISFHEDEGDDDEEENR